MVKEQKTTQHKLQPVRCNIGQRVDPSWLFRYRHVSYLHSHIQTDPDYRNSCKRNENKWKEIYENTGPDIKTGPTLQYVLLMHKQLKSDLLLLFIVLFFFSTNGNKYICCSCKIHLSQSTCGFVLCLLLHRNILAAFCSSFEGRFPALVNDHHSSSVSVDCLSAGQQQS